MGGKESERMEDQISWGGRKDTAFALCDAKIEFFTEVIYGMWFFALNDELCKVAIWHDCAADDKMCAFVAWHS